MSRYRVEIEAIRVFAVGVEVSKERLAENAAMSVIREQHPELDAFSLSVNCLTTVSEDNDDYSEGIDTFYSEDARVEIPGTTEILPNGTVRWTGCDFGCGNKLDAERRYDELLKMYQDLRRISDENAREVFSAPMDQIRAEIVSAGGDPDAVGKRGAKIAMEAIARRRDLAIEEET